VPSRESAAAADASTVPFIQRERGTGIFARLREMRQGRALGGSLREAIEGGRD